MRQWIRIGLVALAGTAVAACGSSGGSKSGGSSKSTPTSKPATGSTDATSTTLQVESTAIGKVVANSKGLTLYEFVPDGSSTTSKVPENLLSAWPPLQATQPPTLGPGLTATVGTATQPNGQDWVVYNGHLLYAYSGDAKAGDINGNGLGNIWYALTPAGEPVQS
ncbi:MAG: COG4315 family predicted lipoprotein [Acidimicrobiia bacterium]